MNYNSSEAFMKDRDKALRRIFSGSIKANFLIDMKYKVINMFGEEISNYYDLNLTDEKLVSIDFEMFDFDICRHIVGLHRSNLIFNTEEERLEKEKSSKYKDLLAKEVIENIKLREFGSAFFRKKSLLKGDNFIFFHIPYDLFVLCANMTTLLKECEGKSDYYPFFVAISYNGLAALSLLEDNFLVDVYPICRGIIELYVKFLTLKSDPSAFEHYKDFTKYERQKTNGGRLTKELEELYVNRINKSCRNKIDYLHFGWLDYVKDYHSKEKRPYSISGIIAYLKSIYRKSDSIIFEDLEQLYKKCHTYTHGSTYMSKYPLLHYFEISKMLFYTIFHTYILLCEYLDIDKDINGIDIVNKLNKDSEQLQIQYEKCSTENFEKYYNDQFNQF